MGALLSSTAVEVAEDIIARRTAALTGFQFLSASYSLASAGRKNKLASVYVDYKCKDVVYSISANDNHFVEFSHRQWSAFSKQCTLERLGSLHFHHGNDLFRIERVQRFGKSFINVRKENHHNVQSVWLTVEEFKRLTHLQPVLTSCGEALVRDLTIITISIQKIFKSGGPTPHHHHYWWYTRLEKEVVAQIKISHDEQHV
jgi:hypothetical protein